MKKTFLFLAALAMSAMMMAETVSDTIFIKGFANGTSTSYVTSITEGQSKLGVTVEAQQYVPSSGQIKGNQTNPASQFLIYNTTAFPGAITNIAVVAATDGTNYLKNKVYVALGTESQAGVASVDGLAAWAEDFTWAFDAQNNYSYFKLLSNEKFTNGSVKDVKVIVTYVKGTTPQRVLESIYIDGTASKLEYFEGESFDVAGLKVMGKYADELGDSEITGGIEWSIVPGTLALGTTSVTVTATAGGKTSDPKTVNNIVVKEAALTMDVTFDFPNNLYGHTGVSASGVTDGDIAIGEKFTEEPAQIEFTVNGSTQTRFWDASSKHELRLYNGATFVLSVVGDYKITKVEFTGSAVNLTGNGVAVSNKVWEGNAVKSVTFVNTSTTSKINSIKVTYIAVAPAAANPTLSQNEGVFFDAFNLEMACETEGAAIYYTLDGSNPTVESAVYSSPISISATTTVKAMAVKDGLDNSEIVSAAYKLGNTYASLAALVAAGTPTEEGEMVRVTITAAVIDSFYVNKSGNRNGIYVTVANTAVELYEFNVPETWVAGGKVSGTIIAEWLLYKGTAELQKWENGWNAFEYTAPGDPTALQDVMMKSNIRKAMHNGRIMIMKGDKMFNLHGMLVK